MSTPNGGNPALPIGQDAERVARAFDRDAQTSRMDRMYRLQRHVYDLTRKYYLFGRDTLLSRMDPKPGQTVLEAGCGTGRNLAILARRHPAVRFFGLDPSQEMLKTAATRLQREGLGERVLLRQALAEDLDPERLFGLRARFDVIYFSYTLSMIPTWPAAVDAALACLAPQGKLCIVDFHDLGGLVPPARWLLRRWLALFGVHFRPELLEYLAQAGRTGRFSMRMESLPLRYAFLAELRGLGVTSRSCS